MNKPISSCMEKHVVSVGVEDTAERVREVFDIHQLTCVPVIDAQGQCFGVLSATDLIHFCNSRENPKSEHAWEMCTHQIIEVSVDLSIREASELMVKHNIHHLLVVEDNQLKGIVSSIDLIGEFLKQSAD
ncbi:CBS domain-containing protein [Aliikangiella marina]|uniref:CBS domain-containing protein n=1 Tax=Aliikangiella marina TaxID=1712262 RepID=A0A545T6P9_9GAMM|nr:CBS domain-containing protein [Aliikangiella marina]TQV72896.1 CBS domain-containing protein [Aliikangiella marina]